MSSFDYFWQLVEHHGGVAEFYKLRAGKFVSYNPAKAIIENAPRKETKELRILSGREADRAKAQGMKVVVARVPDGTFKMVLAQDAEAWGLKVEREF